jgi:hypothetical protein
MILIIFGIYALIAERDEIRACCHGSLVMPMWPQFLNHA